MREIDSAIEAINELAEAAKAAGKFELNDRVLRVQQTLIGLLQENLSLVAENRDIRRKLDEAASAASQRAEFVYRGNAYWRETDGHEEGPFCSVCLDDDQKAIRLNVLPNGVGLCGKCKNTAQVSESRSDPVMRVPRRSQYLDERF